MNTLEMHTLIWIIQKILQSNDHVSLKGKMKMLKNLDISHSNLQQAQLYWAHIFPKQTFTSGKV